MHANNRTVLENEVKDIPFDILIKNKVSVIEVMLNCFLLIHSGIS